LLQLTQLYE